MWSSAVAPTHAQTPRFACTQVHGIFSQPKLWPCGRFWETITCSVSYNTVSSSPSPLPSPLDMTSPAQPTSVRCVPVGAEETVQGKGRPEVSSDENEEREGSFQPRNTRLPNSFTIVLVSFFIIFRDVHTVLTPICGKSCRYNTVSFPFSPEVSFQKYCFHQGHGPNRDRAGTHFSDGVQTDPHLWDSKCTFYCCKTYIIAYKTRLNTIPQVCAKITYSIVSVKHDVLHDVSRICKMRVTNVTLMDEPYGQR